VAKDAAVVSRLYGGLKRAARRPVAWAIALISVGVIVSVAVPASAATTTVLPTADAMVQEANASTNYGTSTMLRVDGGSDPDVQTYLRFAVAGLSGTVQSAKLRVYTQSDTTSSGPAVYTTADTWGETTITWGNKTALVGSGVSKLGALTPNAYAEFDVTSLVSGDGTYDFVLAGTSTDGVNFDSREATNKPQLVITSGAADTGPPTAPTNLSAAAPSGTQVDLAWTASTDDTGVTNYEIFRGGSLLRTVGAVTTFSDTSVSPNTAYSYQVRAIDTVGNRSGFSNTASVTTPSSSSNGTILPSADAMVQEASASTNFGTSTALRVDGGSDPDVQTYFRFPVSGLSGTVQSAKLRVYATSPTADGPAVYTTADTWGETSITWGNKTALVGSGVGKLGSIGSNAYAEFDVTSLISGNGTYDFVLAGTSTDGVDFQSREAANKPQLVITTTGSGDTQNPTDPTGLTATAVSLSRVDLAWTASTDDVGVTNYEIFRDGSLLTTVGAVTSYSDTTVAPNTSYAYKVRAMDAATNRSGFSAVANATTPSDADPPTAPAHLAATAPSASRVDLTWDASTDNVGVTNYRIIRDGSTLITIGAVTSYSDTSVSAATAYEYTVKAIDAATNASGPSNAADVTTPGAGDTTNPSDPTNLTATAVSGSQINLAWTGSTDNVGVTNYEIFRGGSLLTTVGAVTAYSDTGLANGTQYSYKVRALDAANNMSGFSSPVSATTFDTAPPSNPTNLTATAVGTTRADLAWTAATDNVGVTNYEIFRGGVLLTMVGAVTSYSDTSVTTGSTYSYQVRALDAASNRSIFSNTATVTMGDTVVPSNPTNLGATAAAYNRIDLAWTASTDNVGVTNYEIFRGGSLLTTVGAVTTYSDTTVGPGLAYSYQVRALDLAGNRSGFSNTASATTPQQVATFVATADARVEEANPSTNFGTATALRTDAGTGAQVDSYVQFSAAGLQGSVRSATLRVYASSATVDGPAVYPTSTGWSETGITWANKPAATGAAAADAGAIATGTWVVYDVTSLVNGNGTFAFLLSQTSTDGTDFHSREAANKPQLVVSTGAPDTQAPTAPTGLTASAASSTRVDLSWNQATDDVLVTNYLVYRGTTLLATLGASTLSYSDTNVSANTTYTYTVKARDGANNLSGPSNAATVTTPDSGSGSTVTIAVAGDIACATTDAAYNGGNGTSTACRQKATSNLLVGAGYAAVLALGDNQYNSGSLSQYQASYDPTWGRVKSITHPVTGNHEYGTSNASGYFSYYGSSAGDPSKGYYSFDVGTWHLIALNSNCTIIACTAGSAQETWLRNDLATHPNVCTLAFDHHARWSSGHDGDNTFMQPMWQDLYDANAELFLSGHSHNYERFAPQNATGGLDNTRGVRQFVVGSGGAFFTGVGSAHANSQVRNNDTYGILKLTLRPTGYDWQFVPEAGRTFTDSGSTACH
jgi:fibronectin type 3 domain-containing protein